MKELIISLGHSVFRIQLRYPAASMFFLKYVLNKEEVSASEIADIIVIPPVDEVAIKAETERLKCKPAYAEYSLLLENFSNRLLTNNLFFFHGAAFIWHNNAFIFTGKSGIGKTTQLQHWHTLFPDEIEIINGDKPVIEYDHNLSDGKSEFMVYPSPWNGKEGWNGNNHAPLAGIILLEQGDHDELIRLTEREAVFPVFLQFLFTPDNRSCVENVCDYEEQMLIHIPVFKLINCGTAESALLTHKFLLENLDGISST